MFSDYEIRIFLSFFLACITASYGGGYQFQAMYYLLVVLLGGLGASYEPWLGASGTFVVYVYMSGVIRSTHGKK